MAVIIVKLTSWPKSSRWRYYQWLVITRSPVCVRNKVAITSLDSCNSLVVCVYGGGGCFFYRQETWGSGGWNDLSSQFVRDQVTLCGSLSSTDVSIELHCRCFSNLLALGPAYHIRNSWGSFVLLLRSLCLCVQCCPWRWKKINVFHSYWNNTSKLGNPTYVVVNIFSNVAIAVSPNKSILGKGWHRFALAQISITSDYRRQVLSVFILSL